MLGSIGVGSDERQIWDALNLQRVLRNLLFSISIREDLAKGPRSGRRQLGTTASPSRSLNDEDVSQVAIGLPKYRVRRVSTLEKQGFVLLVKRSFNQEYETRDINQFLKKHSQWLLIPVAVKGSTIRVPINQVVVIQAWRFAGESPPGS